MATITSFAPLAARLSAHAAGLRPADGARDTFAKFAALVLCALLDMLILVCEMLDARAAIGVRSVTAPAPLDRKAAFVPAPRVGQQALPGARRARLPSLMRAVGAAAPTLVLTLAGASLEAGETTPADSWLASGHSRFLTAVLPKNVAFPLASTHGYFVTIS